MLDYHLHSHHSPDTSAPMDEMVNAACEAGLQEIAFTEHLEWYPDDNATGYLDPQGYFAELNRLRKTYAGRITLLAGLEMGSAHRFPKHAREVLDAWPWDYVLGSIHWVNNKAGWKSGTFAEGLEAAYAAYFEELAALARHGAYDVLAHFDLVRRDSWSLFKKTLPLDAFADRIRAALRAVVERGKGLEINTSALAMGLPEPSPPLMILRWYRELGGEHLVLGSDAHRPEDVGEQFDTAQEIARAAGFTRLTRFWERTSVGWVDIT